MSSRRRLATLLGAGAKPIDGEPDQPRGDVGDTDPELEPTLADLSPDPQDDGAKADSFRVLELGYYGNPPLS